MAYNISNPLAQHKYYFCI